MNPAHYDSSHRGLQAYGFLILLTIFTACSSDDSHIAHSQRFQKGEYFYRMQQESQFPVPPAEPSLPEPYPWEKNLAGNHLKITKEFFRCRGSSLNPVHTIGKEEVTRFSDCGGAEKHSLPLRENKEFIYPILIDLLNYIQTKTQKRVVITSGHRCPEHNTYVDATKGNWSSKHMIGAEVSFYVQGMEERPEAIVQLLQKYYEAPKYQERQDKKDLIEFHRYEKGDSDVTTPPWYNKEIFIKLYKKKEGRNFDNRHPYPYLSIQVRYDLNSDEKVTFSDKAARNYLRY